MGTFFFVGNFSNIENPQQESFREHVRPSVTFDAIASPPKPYMTKRLQTIQVYMSYDAEGTGATFCVTLTPISRLKVKVGICDGVLSTAALV